MVKANKHLLLAALAVLAVFGGVQLWVIKGNWSEAAAEQRKADEARLRWDKYFKAGPNMLPKPAALQALKLSDDKVAKDIELLKKIEFGTPQSLRDFSEAAAAGDKKSHFAATRTRTIAKAKTLNIQAPTDLGFTEKTLDDSVALNLLRLAMVDRLLNCCKEANIPVINNIRFDTPRFVALPDERSAEEADSEPAPAKAKEPAAPSMERLIQFPIRIIVSTPEPNFPQLMYELQRGTDESHTYFSLRGFHVYVRAQGSGRVEACLAAAALLNEKTAEKLGIQIKADERAAARSNEIDFR